MARASIELVVKVSWWVLPYVQSVALFARMTGQEPDFGKVLAKVLKGIRLEINQCDGCRAGAPLSEMGIHRYSDGSRIACTRDRYTP